MNSYIKFVRKERCPTAGVMWTDSHWGLFSTKTLAPETPAAQKTSSAASDLCLLLCMPDILKGNRVCILYREQGREEEIRRRCLLIRRENFIFFFNLGLQAYLSKL